MHPTESRQLPTAVNIVGPLLGVLSPVLDKAQREGRRVVVGIAGESGSGKSMTAASLALGLTTHGIPTALLCQDNYGVHPPRARAAMRAADPSGVGPQELRLALLAEHISAFRGGAATVKSPVLDQQSDRFTERTLELHHVQALVVEGSYALLLPDLDVRIFMEATHAETHRRRSASGTAPSDGHTEFLWVAEQQYITPQAASADWLIDRDFCLRAAVERA